MRQWLALAVVMTAGPAAARPPIDLFAGTFTNEEDVYFAKEAGRAPPPETRLSITQEAGGFRLRTIDAFGKPLEDGHLMQVAAGPTLTTGKCGMPFKPVKDSFVALPRTGTCRNAAIMERFSRDGISLRLEDGTSMTMLRRARPVTCWAAVPKDTKKPDGSDDWYGVRDMKLHDQGGRAAFGGGTTGAKATEIKVRNVIWPSGLNRPSLVLYVFTPDAPDKAVAYSWADPGATRIGINLRWMQASCTIDVMEKSK